MPRKRALILSPFATVPADAGQRKRARQSTKLLRDNGYEITFLLYAFEEGWKTRNNEAWVDEMRREWDEVIVWRADGKVGETPSTGPLHNLDEWWEASLEIVLTKLFRSTFYDVFVVHNVWLSKAFDFAPKGTARILDAHDVFSMRQAYFGHDRGVGEFFLPAVHDEVAGINRGEMVLGIQPNDTAWFADHAKADAFCLPYKAEIDASRIQTRNDYLHKDKVVFGFLGSDHVFNVRGLRAYCAELKDLVGYSAAPVELRIGGRIGEAIEARGPWVMDGYVGDENEFLKKVDIVVVPVFDGTGFKVKVADTAAYHKPMIMAEHAAIGMSFDKEVVATGPADLARMTVDIALHRPDYTKLQNITRNAAVELETRTTRATSTLLHKIETQPRAILYDLTGLSVEEASCVLLSWSGAFHVMRMLAKQYVIAPDALRIELAELGPAGVFFITEEKVSAIAKEVWRWITVANVNPEKWGANPKDVWIDPVWHGVIENAASGAMEEGADPSRSHFWHSVGWDQMARRLIKLHSPSSAARALRKKETILIVDDSSRSFVAELTGKLFGANVRLADISDFRMFFELAIQIAAGELQRLVIADTAMPARVAALWNLCAERGIEYIGPIDGGKFGKSQSDVGEMNRRFEEHWRFKREVHFSCT
jgi:hypothetical protein